MLASLQNKTQGRYSEGMSRIQERAGAHAMLEALRRGAPDALPHSDDTQVAHALEARFPGLRFARHPDGRIAAWGRHPAQGFGHLDGCPFYLRVRYGTVHLRLYPHVVPLDALPARHVDELLTSQADLRVPAELTDHPDLSWFPDTHAVIDVLTTAIGDLATPDLTGSQRWASMAAAFGQLTATDLTPAILARFPALRPIGRGGSWELTPSGLYAAPGGSVLEISWGGDTIVTARVYPATRTPAHGHDIAALAGQAPRDLTGDPATAIVNALAAALFACAPVDDRDEPTGYWTDEATRCAADLTTVLGLPTAATAG